MADSNYTATAVSKRLHEALEFSGLTSMNEKIARLANATGRTTNTVKRWLAGECLPRCGLLGIANDLNADWWWLYNGSGCEPRIHFVVQRLMALPEKERDLRTVQITRMCLRLGNGDPKALRLLAMRERGELDMQTFLAMM